MTDQPHRALSDFQFGDYAITKAPFGKSPDSRGGEYKLWRNPKEGEHQDYAVKVGHMNVLDRTGKGGTLYAGPVGLTTPEPPADPAMAQRGWNKTWAEREAKPGETIPLFRHNTARAEHEVTGLYMAKEARHMASTLLGVAQNVAVQETGRGLKPSGNLSARSAPMVDKLQGRGAIENPVQAAVTNSVQWAPTDYSMHGDLEQTVHEAQNLGLRGRRAIPTDEVRAGQHTVRKMLKAGRQRQFPQAHQPELPF